MTAKKVSPPEIQGRIPLVPCGTVPLSTVFSPPSGQKTGRRPNRPFVLFRHSLPDQRTWRYGWCASPPSGGAPKVLAFPSYVSVVVPLSEIQGGKNYGPSSRRTGSITGQTQYSHLRGRLHPASPGLGEPQKWPGETACNRVRPPAVVCRVRLAWRKVDSFPTNTIIPSPPRGGSRRR